MSSTYMHDISDGQDPLVFIKILKRWRGSLYKLVWTDLLFYILAYYVLNLSYRFAMNAQQKHIFEKVVQFCEKTKGDIPISFLLGFFVSGIIARWYNMYMYIPWMNETSLFISTCINGRDEETARAIRLNLMRYLNLSWILMMRKISDQIATRFVPPNDADTNSNAKPGSATTTSAGTKPVKINRSACQPWSFDADHPRRGSPAGGGPSRPRHPSGLPRGATLSTQFSIDPETPSPTMPFLDAEAGDVFGTRMPDPYTSTDDNTMRDTLRALNNDRRVKLTFGALITDNEIKAFEAIAADCYKRTREKYSPEDWVPIQWAQRLVMKALRGGYITDPKTAYYLMMNLGKHRKQMQDLQIYSSIMIPLVYTQVVIIAVYSYFMCQIFASQFTDLDEHDKDAIDLYVPIFSIFSFLFLMGWLKVALCVMNPFGDDDEDFQTSSILDYNLEVSYRTVAMTPESFPDNMGLPVQPSKNKTPDPTDDLNDYIDYTNEFSRKSAAELKAEDFSNLLIEPNTLTKIKNCLCCASCRERGHSNSQQLPNCPYPAEEETWNELDPREIPRTTVNVPRESYYDLDRGNCMPVTNADITDDRSRIPSTEHPSLRKFNWMT